MRLTCEYCEEPINEAKDPHCRMENPYNAMDVAIVCEVCREREWDHQQERLMEDGGGPSLIEQQREAYKIKHGLR